MISLFILVSILTTLFPLLFTGPVSASPHAEVDTTKQTPRSLNVTTLTTNAQRESILECWSVANLSVADTPGIAGALLGNLVTAPSNVGYFDIPPRFDGGLHNAPVVQYVLFASGAAVVSLPNSSTTATAKGGADGLILATDTKNVSTLGHFTTYPSRQRTVGLVIPLPGNLVPEHVVVHGGACRRGK